MSALPSGWLLNVAVKKTRLRIQSWGAFHVFVDAMLITIMVFLAEGKTSVYYAA